MSIYKLLLWAVQGQQFFFSFFFFPPSSFIFSFSFFFFSGTEVEEPGTESEVVCFVRSLSDLRSFLVVIFMTLDVSVFFYLFFYCIFLPLLFESRKPCDVLLWLKMPYLPGLSYSVVYELKILFLVRIEKTSPDVFSR